jgi:acetate kinase
MRGPLLVINAGSSSVKFSLFETAADSSLAAGPHGMVDEINTAPRLSIVDAHGRTLASGPVAARGHVGAIAAINDWFAAHIGSESAFAGVGHRVVHGGAGFSQPVLIDDRVIAALEALVPLAPLHQPHHLAAIRAVAVAAPGVPQIACFDTAFHRTQPKLAQAFALPRAFYEQGVRRYGFHGLSYEYIVSVAPLVLGDAPRARMVIAHLGNGASLCAVRDGAGIATTMGFTPVDGLVMGTRTGLLDPGVILYLLQHDGMDAGAIERLIYEQSGLLGISGLSSDMRTLLASEAPAAKEAVDLFVYRLGRELGSLAAALGGLDALVFAGGIGEHAATIRARVCRDAHWLGIRLDEAANDAGGPRISTRNSPASAWVIPTDENLVVARHMRRILDAGPAS